MRKKCEGDLCYDFSNMERFLNQKSVRDALGVGNIDFVSCSSTVYEAMVMDWMRNLEVGIPTLLEDGIKVLIYAGEYDLICNWLGKLLWLNQKLNACRLICLTGQKFYWQLFNYCSSIIWQVIQDGFMQWNGLVRKILAQRLRFHSWLMVQKQDC